MLDRLLADFRAAKGLKARLTVAQEFTRSDVDLANKETAAKEIIALLNADIPSHMRTQAAVALGLQVDDALLQLGVVGSARPVAERVLEDLAGAAKELAITARRRLAIGSKATTLMIYPAIVMSISIRIMGLLLAAVAIQFMLNAIKAFRLDLISPPMQ